MAAESFMAHEVSTGNRTVGWLRSTVAGIKATALRLSRSTFKIDPEGTLNRAVQGGVNTGVVASQTVNRAPPLPVSAVTSFYSKHVNALRFSDRRDGALVVTAFFGLLRSREVVQLKWGDVIDNGHSFRLLIRHAKTARNGEVQEAFIPKAQDGAFCPYSALKHWRNTCAALGIASAEAPVFASSKEAGHVPLDTPLSVEGVGRAVVDAGRGHGTGYTSHSCRRGGATELMQRGASTEQLRHLGRWKSEASDLYVVISAHTASAAWAQKQ